MKHDPFLVRARRAIRRRPAYLAHRALEALRQRGRRRWSRIAPAVFTDGALLRIAGADSIDALWVRQRARPFFFMPGDRARLTQAYLDAFPSAPEQIIASAEATMRHEFDLLGSGAVPLGDRLPWHTDFKTGREWALEYARDIQYNELDRPTDVKVPWELSRCQHFTALGQAYWFTGDDRYAREFVAEVDDWIARNPWGYGVNWACAMDVALRAVSWLWGFYFFAESQPCRDGAFRGRFLRSLFLHGEHIATHLERGDVNGNHYLCDGVGLVFLGVFFGETRKGRRWLESGRSIVVEEIERQTSVDGVDFEQSTSYHRLVLEGFVTPYLLLRAARQPVPDAAWSRLERMFEFVEAYTKPDGSVPLIGDADDGRVQKLGPQPLNDHRYLLSLGAVLCARADFKRAAGAFHEEAFWLLGTEGHRRFAGIAGDVVPAASKAFQGGGVFVMRNHAAHAVIDCAEVGMHGRGGHGHNDILSFELWMNGANWVTDCGAYLYTASREWRNRFRSTEFHNTVQVDGEEVNRFIDPDALWQVRYDAEPVGASLTIGADADRFSGAHRGYQRLPSPVTVSRDIQLDHAVPRFVVRDTLAGEDVHAIVSRLHLDPAVTADLDGHSVRLSNGAGRLWCECDVPMGFTVTLERGWVSPSYGVKHPCVIIQCAGSGRLPLVLSYQFSESAPSCARSS